MLRVHFLQQWYTLAEDALYDSQALQRFARIELDAEGMPDATLIAAPSSTKNAKREREPALHQTKKGNQWYFGMKAHIGSDRDSKLVHTLVALANVGIGARRIAA